MAEVAERGIAIVTSPFRGGLVPLRLSNTLTGSNKDRSNDSPSDDRTAKHGESRVHANQDTASDEGRGPFEPPAPTFNMHRPASVSAPDVDPGEEVPVIQDANGVVRSNTLDERSGEGNAERLQLAHGFPGARSTGMHRSDGQGDGGGGGEQQLQFATDLDDEELPQGRDEEEAEERAHQRDGD